MKYVRLYIFLFIIFVPLFSGCDDNYFAENKSSLIVEGWIEDGEYPVVMLTKSLAVSEDETSLDDLSDYMLKWAVVTVSDGEETVVLTGKYDTSYFPPYIYTTGRMRGKSGRKYKLTVQYNEYYAEAETTIPTRPLFDSLYTLPVNGSDSLVAMTACFRDDKSQKGYYQIFVKKGTLSRQYLSAYLGCLHYDVLDEYNEVPVHAPSRFDVEDYTPYFYRGDTVSVKLARLDSLSYSFWSTFEKKAALGSNMMFPYIGNLPCNVKGGMGYWFGYGAEVKHVIVP